MNRCRIIIAAFALLMISGCSVKSNTSQETSVLSPFALKKICASDLAHGMAEITVWRDTKQNIKLFVLQPDPSLVSDAPSLFYDPQGTNIFTAANHPYDPNNASADDVRLAQKIASLKNGLTKSESIFCSQSQK